MKRNEYCPICLNKITQVLYTDSNRREVSLLSDGTYRKCVSCGHVFLDCIPSQIELDEAYSCIVNNKRSAPTSRKAINLVINKVFGVFENQSNKINAVPASVSGRLLDIGCGSAEKLKEYYKRGIEIYGVDTNSEEIKIAKKTLPDGIFFNTTLEQCRFEENLFDVIRMDNVLEHVPDPLATLNEAQRILKTGGIFVIYIPRGDSLLFSILKKYHSNSWIPFHLNLFSRSSIKKIFEKAGIKTQKINSLQPLSWIGLSAKQFLYRPVYGMKLGTISRLILCFFYPLSFILRRFGVGDEFVVIGTK
jgi:SAM-dependent methyltransferase